VLLTVLRRDCSFSGKFTILPIILQQLSFISTTRMGSIFASRLLTGISYAHYTFQSSSDITQFGQEIFEFTMKGYWPDKKDSEYTRLIPGLYTVVAGDEWGALVLVHFTVTGKPSQTTTTSPD